MQNPHCKPAVAAKQSAMSEVSSSGRPSSVTTSLPSAFLAFIAQVTTALPPTTARQQPHWPCGEQPSLTLVTPQRFRRTSRSDSSSRGSTSTDLPFRSKRMLIPFPNLRCGGLGRSEAGNIHRQKVCCHPGDKPMVPWGCEFLLLFVGRLVLRAFGGLCRRLAAHIGEEDRIAQ